MADYTSEEQGMLAHSDGRQGNQEEWKQAIVAYLVERVPVFRNLTRLRHQGWMSAEGDNFFERQRQQADNPSPDEKEVYFNIMTLIAIELERKTGVFTIPTSQRGAADNGPPPAVLDFCMAPGGFLKAVMERNPDVQVTAFTLPESAGGHEILLDAHLCKKINLQTLDITMLADDMGISREIISCHYAEHVDRRSFLPRKLSPDLLVDLVLCDGQVLRTHERAAYREDVEVTRLACVQFALGLEHLRPGGTMLILHHKIEVWDSINMLHILSKFADVQVYKPRKSHAKRSSFYVVAKNVQSQCPAAKEALGKWKNMWMVATFESPEELRKIRSPTMEEVNLVLEEFGSKLIKLGIPVWKRQADALARAPFIRG